MALKCCDSTSGFREAQIKANKGYVWKQLKKYARAEEEFLGSLEIYESVGDVEPTCDELDALNGLVILYLKMKKYDQVERFWRIEQNRIAGGGQQHQREELYLYNCYGVYQYKRKCFDRALEVLSKGIVLCERYKNINYNLVYAHLLANRALVRIKKRQGATALEDLNIALKMAQDQIGVMIWMYQIRIKIFLKFFI